MIGEPDLTGYFNLGGEIILKQFWEGWKRVGQWIGDALARIILTVFYFTIFLPFGLLTRLFSDPLAIRTSRDEHWVSRTTGDQTLEDVRRLS